MCTAAPDMLRFTRSSTPSPYRTGQHGSIAPSPIPSLLSFTVVCGQADFVTDRPTGEPTAMSGHSKWSTIKHKKGAADAKRGAIFTKLAKGLTVAAQNGGGDPEMNFSLRLAVDGARAANMPKDNIDRAIQRGVGGDKATALDDVTYEGYGPGGVAIIVEATTDNRNRTAGQVRSVFTKHGCSLGESGTVAWQLVQAARGDRNFNRAPSVARQSRPLPPPRQPPHPRLQRGRAAMRTPIRTAVRPVRHHGRARTACRKPSAPRSRPSAPAITRHSAHGAAS